MGYLIWREKHNMLTKFFGNHTRNIKLNGVDCVSMPSSVSFVKMPVSLRKDVVYKISIFACSNGGNGMMELLCSNVIFDKPCLFAVTSKVFQKYVFFVGIKKTLDVQDQYIVISRTKTATGNVFVSNFNYNVDYKKTYERNTDLEEEKRKLKKKQDLERRNQIGKKQLELYEKERQQKLEYIYMTRGVDMASPISVGGTGYRWRGRNLKTTIRNGATCVTMPYKDSIIIVPASVLPNSKYKVTIDACKSSGNGDLLVNFFAGKNFDGTHIPLSIDSTVNKKHTVFVSTLKFPNNLPVYLRIFKPEGSSGNIFIASVVYEKIGSYVVKDVYKIPKTKPLKIKKEAVKEKLPIVVAPKTPTPKYKPCRDRYSVAKVDRVLIREQQDVPLVSIITPTREGKHLIEKCYAALVQNTKYPNWEWIVGDSNSKDGTVDYLKSLNDPRVKVVERKTVDGSFSSINNELTKVAAGEYYVFLNNDTEPQLFWLYEMMSKIIHHPEVGVVGSRLMYDKKSIQHCGIVFVPDGPANIGREVLKEFDSGFETQDRYYQAVTGACLLISAHDFERVGGFGECYHFCYEDVDLCLKVKEQLNKLTIYAANSIVIHKESVTQKKHVPNLALQNEGIKVFKDKWMTRGKTSIDYVKYRYNIRKNVLPVDVSFVTCVSNLEQYTQFVVGSLFKSVSNKNYEIIPILNTNNQYSAAQALNIGIEKARANIVVLVHQDVLFYDDWIDLLFDRIDLLPTKNWGVLGTAGITTRDDTIGVIHNIKGRLQWQPTKASKVAECQTVDEHCMIIRKDSGLRFDGETFTGYHFYGCDIALTALQKQMKNYGILCPLVHHSASGSLDSGKKEYMRYLKYLSKKWRDTFRTIRTSTAMIRKGKIRTFIKF